MIAAAMNAPGYTTVTWALCDKKLRNLKIRYRSILDHHHKSCRGRKQWLHFDLLQDIFAESPATVEARNHITKRARISVSIYARIFVTFPLSSPINYCHANSTATYFKANLNIRKMYRLYCTKCQEDGIQPQYEKVLSLHFQQRIQHWFSRPEERRLQAFSPQIVWSLLCFFQCHPVKHLPVLRLHILCVNVNIRNNML